MRYPSDFTYPKEKTVTAHVAAQMIAGLSPARRTVVQAGGCAGLWPLALGHHFERVYTFEPAPTNVACLLANVADAPHITAFPWALGEARGGVHLTRPRPQAGLWRVEGDGDIPMVPLDEVVDGPIDALVLDVEGAEVRAWQGAERVITTHRPLLWFECHTADAEADISAFLSAHGYHRPVLGIGSDYYSRHHERTP